MGYTYFNLLEEYEVFTEYDMDTYWSLITILICCKAFRNSFSKTQAVIFYRTEFWDTYNGEDFKEVLKLIDRKSLCPGKLIQP